MARPLVLAALLSVVTVAAASAHDAVKAIVRLSNGEAQVDRPCVLDVSVLAPPGLPIVQQIRRVSVSGEMTGHAMPPLEVDLTPARDPGAYNGQLTFSMAGPWRLRLRIDVLNEPMWAVIDLPVRGEGEPVDPRPHRYVVEMQDPVRATVFAPARTLGAAVAFTLVLEVAALVIARRRDRWPPRRGRSPAIS